MILLYRSAAPLLRMYACRFKRRICVVDTSNDIAGDGCRPHPQIGDSTRLQVVSRIRKVSCIQDSPDCS